MNKTVLFSLAAATLLFTACGEETKKAAEETAQAAEKTVQAAAKESKEAVEKTVEKAKEATKETVEKVKKEAAPVIEKAEAKAVETAEATKTAVKKVLGSEENVTTKPEAETEKAVETTATEANNTVSEAAPTANVEAGKTLYTKCASCHGNDGKMKALGVSAVIAGQSAEEIAAKLAEYKAGTRNTAGMGNIMKPQVMTLSEEDMKAVAEYIATLK